LRSRLSELSTKASAARASLGGLVRAKENASQQIESIKGEIEESRDRAKQLAMERDELLKEISEKQAAYEAICNEAAQARSNFEQESKKVRASEEQLDRLRQEAVSLRSEQVSSQSRVDVYSERSKDLEERRRDLVSSLNRLEGSLKELGEIRKEQLGQLRNLQNALGRRTDRRRILETEVREAGKIADVAREALVEFEAQKELAEKVKPEETALKHIEELGGLGVIPGVDGRLRNLVEIRRGYERVVEAAASGWLDSLIVENLDVAFACVETLRRLRLGRIKIIPLQGLSPSNRVSIPQIEGISDRASAFVKHDGKYVSAVSFVLGDTLLAADERAALMASHTGLRSVTLNGDLYEAGGGVESGFYRTPVNFSSFVPSESALKTLDKAVEALKNSLSTRETYIGELEKEITETQQEITRLAEASAKLEGEVERASKSIHQTKLNSARAETNVTTLQNLLQQEKAQIELYEKRRDELASEEARIQQELADLKRRIDPSVVHEREQKRELLGNEIIMLRQKVGETETELSTLQSKIESVLKVSLENASVQLEKATRQMLVLEKEIEESAREKEEAQKKIGELEKAKEDLSRALLDAKGETQKFTSQIDGIDGQLAVLEKEYEQTDGLLDELRLNLQTFQLQMGRRMEQLRAMGYEEPLEVSSRQLEEAEALLKLMRFELERIGAVNQLAQTQYEDQVSRYKELSVRMNELEKEKMAIANFIEEIERKKYNAFMGAFNQINERIDRYFAKLTDGGNAALKLENPENPFAGGVDMVVQFVEKPPILVSGASSGERSVCAVAFLFALQEFTPASFYLLDEIDAHLDAFHVERLGELLAEEAEGSQFVVVTLKPEMVSKADRIYGVYDREGISYVVSTTFKGVAQ